MAWFEEEQEAGQAKYMSEYHREQEGVLMETMKRIVASVMCIAFLFTTSAMAAAVGDADPGKLVKSEKKTASAMRKHFEKQRGKDAQVKKIHEHLKKEGYAPATTDGNYYGEKQVYQDADGQTVDTEVYIQDYVKSGSKDKVALGQAVITSGQRSEVYNFYLVARDGKFDEAKEYTIDADLNVVDAHSWWSCVRARLLNCAAPCVTALITCSGTWAAYLGCVAIACGGCYTRIAACCGCNCSWWCRYGVGCCRQ